MTTVINKGQIGEQDLYRFDGSGTNTFTRDTSTGATLTLNKFGYEVNALTAYGGGTVLTDATITAALTALGAVNPCTLLITPGAWTISNDLTITSNIVLKVVAGATLEVAAGKTLTIEGPIDAPSLDIFTGTGTTTITTTNSITQGIWTGSTGFTFGGGKITAPSLKITTGAGANKTLISDADGDLSYTDNALSILDAEGAMLYASAANVLAKLAKGTANYKMFMNAGGAAPEWASGIYVGTFTRVMDAESGDVSYTGTGFTPSFLIVFSVLGNASSSVGLAGSSHSYVNVVYGAATTYYQPNDSTCIWILEASGKEQKALLKTFDSNGFTLTWTKVGSPASATAQNYYIAFR